MSEELALASGHNERELRRRIIEQSVAKDWSIARLEWDLETIFREEEFQACACGHYPIIEICQLRNRLNRQLIEVGNVCVKKFLGMPSEIIFAGFRRVAKDEERALNEAASDYAFRKGWVTEWERNFLYNTSRIRKLSSKQLAKRVEINQRVLRKMEART